VYNLSEIALYATASKNLNVYAGLNSDYTKQTLVATMSTVSTTINGTAIGEGKILVSDLATTVKSAPDVVAQYVTFEYNGGDFKYYEMIVKGTAIDTENGQAVDFRSADNIAYLRSTNATQHNSSYWSSGYGPYNNQRQWSTDGSVNGADHRLKGASDITLTLNSTYDISEIRMYLNTLASKSFDVYVYDTTLDKSETSTQKVGTLTTSETVTVNGVQRQVGTIKLDSAKRGQKVTFVYSGSSSAYFNEIYVAGEEVINTIDFTTAENIAYQKPITHIKGDYYSNGTPTETNQKATDGDISTGHSGKRTEGGIAFRLDLEAVYNISEVTMYFNTNYKDYNLYVGTTPDNGVLVAEVPENRVALNVNGTRDIYETGVELTEVYGRYITIDYPSSGYDFPYSEIIVKGTPVTELVSYSKSYAFDAETGVSVQFKLFNGDESASTAGKVYFAAYNASDILLGVASTDVAALNTNEGATVAPAAFKVSEEPAYVKAFYWADKLIPVTEPISFK